MAIDFPASPTIGDVFIVGVVTYVWDGVKWTSSATNSPFSLGSAATPSITFINDSNTGLYSPGADQVSITTGGTERFRVDAAGQLEAVNLGTAATPAYSFTTDPNTGIYSPGADQIAISTGGTGRLFVDSSGNVTINGQGDLRLADSDSSNWLAFQAPSTVASNVTWTLPSADGTANQVLKTDGAGNLSWGSTSSSSITQGDTTAEVIDTGSDGRFIVTTDGSERLRVNNVGQVGVGTASPTTRLDVSGSYAANAVAVAALNIDCSLGNYFTKTINGASTFTVSNVPASRNYAFTLELEHTSGAITWFSGVEWPGGTAPTLTTGKTHLFIFQTDNGGTRWRGSSLINYTT